MSDTCLHFSGKSSSGYLKKAELIRAHGQPSRRHILGALQGSHLHYSSGSHVVPADAFSSDHQAVLWKTLQISQSAGSSLLDGVHLKLSRELSVLRKQSTPWLLLRVASSQGPLGTHRNRPVRWHTGEDSEAASAAHLHLYLCWLLGSLPRSPIPQRSA